MNKRLKELRKSEKLNLSQREFGRRLGVQDTAISKLESGERNLTDQMILAICREFNVNKEWLRTGGGEMFIESDDTNITAVASEFGLDDLSKTILATYVNMDAEKRTMFNSFIQKMADMVMAESKEKARIGINDIIFNAKASDAVKLDLASKASVVFAEAFPHIGFGNATESELDTDIEAEIASYRHELETEKRAAEKSSASPDVKEA